MKKKINNLITVFLVLILLAGLSLLLYPTFSDWWNSYHQTKAIASYVADVANLSNEDYEKIWKAATEYNASLSERNSDYTLTEEQKKQYEQLLNVSGDGIMGYIEIPSINCSLPIYHGTQESVLQIAVGHIEWSSLPVGGASSHCVVSGHRGLPSAKLFTNLDELSKGDTFMLRVLDEVLTYEVDQILIVEPQETGALQIEEGKDYCTLVTCTPYGINTHRLLVRGRRITTPDKLKHIRVTSDAIKIEPILTAPIMALPLLLVLLFWLLFAPSKRSSAKDKTHKTQ